MSNAKRFFNSMMMMVLFVAILVVFSIGYKTFFVDAGHGAMGKSESSSQTAEQANAGGSPQANEAAEKQAAGQQQYAGNAQAPVNGAPTVSQKAAIRKNEEKLEEIISKLNDTMQSLTMETIVASGDTGAGDKQRRTSNRDMGLKYDAEKMAQLHSSMYKIAMGKAILDQLRDNLADQVVSTDQAISNPAQYYSGLYNQTVQNKALLRKALSHMGDAANLVNLNPYVSEDGLPYDSDRMGRLHQSVLKLAEVLAAADLLESSLAQQAEDYAAYVYSVTPAVPANATYGYAMNSTVPADAAYGYAMNPAAPANAMPADAASANHAAAAPGAGIFGGLNMDAIVEILPFAFGAFFLLGMITTF
jgi:predicted lipid-binding transport protein (Tim44 family)